MRPLTVWPPGNCLLRRLTTLVDSAFLGRKLDVWSFVTSPSFEPSGARANSSTIQPARTNHFVRRPATMTARRRNANLSLGSPIAARLSLRLDEPPPDCVAHELDAVAHAELAQNVGAMGLNGLLGQVQDLGDLGVRVRLGDQLDHLLLAGRQRLARALRAVL